jgi:predicted dehydrogenase
VASGALGELRHVEGHYLQCWLTQDWQTSPPLLWRLSSRHGSMGVLGDVGVHLLDLVSFVAGDIAELTCELPVFNKGVKRIGEYALDVNDSMLAIARFKNGARGTLNATRWAKGNGNSVALRLHGTKGALDLDLDRPPEEHLKVSLGKGLNALKWVTMKCPPVPNQQQRFFQAIRTGKQGQTSFEGGLKIQEYLEACFKSARRNGAWVMPGK